MVEVKHNMKIFKMMLVCFLVTILSITPPVTASNSLLLKERNIDHENKFKINVNIIINSESDSIVTADLKIKPPSGDWADNSITGDVGDTIEFQVNLELSRPYIWFGAVVELPKVNDEPMFRNIRSISPKPIFPFGSWRVSDTEVGWSWFGINESSWSKTPTFKATINKKGSQTINLIAGGNYVDGGQNKEGQATDSNDIIVRTAKSKQKILLELPNKLINVYKDLTIIKTKIYLIVTKI